MKLIFATNNQNKANEIAQIIPGNIQILTLQQALIDIDIPEPWTTLEENAREKALTIYKLTNTNCFSEDTGLEVAALGGAPGVKSARYAGEMRSDEANIKKLLSNLEGLALRAAQFRTVACLIWEGKEYFFEGICKGTIAHKAFGSSGFGYDPVFIPDGADKSFAQMKTEEKNAFSHRKKAMTKLVTFLNNLS